MSEERRKITVNKYLVIYNEKLKLKNSMKEGCNYDTKTELDRLQLTE